MERLPAELVYYILRRAAIDSVCVDREWVVQLVLVSRFVRELVSPILYHTMFVARRNHLKIEALAAAAETNAHIFRAVRCLVADNWLDLWDCGQCCLFSNVTAIDGSLHMVEMLSRNPKSCLRRLAVRYGCLFDLPDRLPTSTLAGVTHIAGYNPSTGYSLDDLAERLEKLLNSMPALTHVALEMVSLMSYDTSDDDSDAESGVSVAVDVPRELASLAHMLRGTLQRPLIQAVSVRVATPHLPHWPAILAVLTQLRDTRLSAWRDTRRIRSWERQERLLAADAMAGRSIWSEARQVWWPNARGPPAS